MRGMWELGSAAVDLLEGLLILNGHCGLHLKQIQVRVIVGMMETYSEYRTIVSGWQKFDVLKWVWRFMLACASALLGLIGLYVENVV